MCSITLDRCVLGCSRLHSYILNWIYRVYTTPHYRAYIAWTCGVIQTALFADFFYHYVKA